MPARRWPTHGLTIAYRALPRRHSVTERVTGFMGQKPAGTSFLMDAGSVVIANGDFQSGANQGAGDHGSLAHPATHCGDRHG